MIDYHGMTAASRHLGHKLPSGVHEQEGYAARPQTSIAPLDRCGASSCYVSCLPSQDVCLVKPFEKFPFNGGHSIYDELASANHSPKPLLDLRHSSFPFPELDSSWCFLYYVRLPYNFVAGFYFERL